MAQNDPKFLKKQFQKKKKMKQQKSPKAFLQSKQPHFRLTCLENLKHNYLANIAQQKYCTVGGYIKEKKKKI